MGIEIKVTGATPLDVLAALTAYSYHCMTDQSVVEAANRIAECEKAGPYTPPVKDSAAPPNPALPSGAAPTPGFRPAPGMTTPSADAAPAAAPAPAQTPDARSVPAGMFQSYPQNPAPAGNPGGVPVNPTMPGNSRTSTMTPTFPSEQQYIPGMAPAAGGVPGPGAGPLPVSAASGFTAAQVSKAGADLVTANPAKRAEVNALLQQYGVQTLTELKPEQLGPFALALRGMGANI